MFFIDFPFEGYVADVFPGVRRASCLPLWDVTVLSSTFLLLYFFALAVSKADSVLSDVRYLTPISGSLETSLSHHHESSFVFDLNKTLWLLTDTAFL